MNATGEDTTSHILNIFQEDVLKVDLMDSFPVETFSLVAHTVTWY